MRCVGGHHTSLQYTWREQSLLQVSYTGSGPSTESILPAHTLRRLLTAHGVGLVETNSHLAVMSSCKSASSDQIY